MNAFSGKWNAYTRARKGANVLPAARWKYQGRTCARKKGKIHVMYMVGEVAFTSRRVVFLNRRLVFSNHRVVKLNPGLVKPTPGVSKPTPGLVTPIRRNFFLPFWPPICINCATQRHSICKEQSAAVILQRHQTNSHYSSSRNFILRLPKNTSHLP